jgi:hypothetical protein
MPSMKTQSMKARNLKFLTTPLLWPRWPILPVVRRQNGDEELGLICDLLGCVGLAGYSATVFLTNVFEAPNTVSGLLKLRRESFDTAEELFEAGWRVD